MFCLCFWTKRDQNLSLPTLVPTSPFSSSATEYGNVWWNVGNCAEKGTPLKHPCSTLSFPPGFRKGEGTHALVVLTQSLGVLRAHLDVSSRFVDRTEWLSHYILSTQMLEARKNQEGGWENFWVANLQNSILGVVRFYGPYKIDRDNTLFRIKYFSNFSGIRTQNLGVHKFKGFA